MRLKPVIASFATLFLAIVSTTFVLLTLTSKEWSIQKYYQTPDGGGSKTTWVTPLCVAHRSPFYRCGIPIVTYDANTNKTNCTVPACQFYKPYGRNRTSCRLPVETGSDSSSFNGGEQECQQVHWTGNLQIAASFFLTFSLILLVTLTLVNVITGLFTSSPHDAPPTTSEDPDSTSAPKPHHQQQSHPRSKPAPGTPYVLLLLLFSLTAGALLQILAQFFAILGLVVNATPNPDQATQNGTSDFGASAWMMGRALTAFAIVAWTMAGACAVMVVFMYRTSRFTTLV